MVYQVPTLTEVARAYDERFVKGDLCESASFYKWVIKCLGPTQGTTLLDISCGEGHLIKWASHLSALTAWGVDISAVALTLSRQRVPDARLARCDGINIPFPDNTFDYATNLGSLEHYADITQGIHEIVRVLKPGGKCAILLPNSYYLADILWLVLRSGYGPSHQQLVEQFATVGEWKDMLTKGGFEILQTYPYNFRFPQTAADWKWYRHRPRRLLKLLLAPFVPFNLSYCFLFVGRKPQQAP
jgi:ubiquinone/menaquinone biosynthesis C-methylase UbiE